MFNLADIGNRVVEIRNASNAIEIKGRQNAALIVFINTSCDEIVQMINETVKEIQNGNSAGENQKEESSE